ncbi:MAG: SpoIIE family protein phosphatase, partial [Leptospiraceae bacterium]|nr:SpoIIE family protein phosphatase [Leptospiraceae bacterium]
VIISKGVLDLRNDPELLSDIIDLKGEWKYKYSKNLNEEIKELDGFVNIPYLWNYSSHESERSHFAQSKYRLKILFPKSFVKTGKIVALHVKFAAGRYKVEVFNNKEKLIASSQNQNYKKTNHLHFRRPIYFSFIPEDEVYIDFYIKNEHHYFGGPGTFISIGSPGKLNRKILFKALLDGTLHGLLWIIALYHLTLFLIRRKDKTPLWFGLFCIVSSGWSFVDQHYLEIVNDSVLSFYIIQYIFEICFFSMSYMFVLYIYELLDLKVLKNSKKILVAFCISVALINLAIPLKYTIHIYLRYVFYFSIFMSIIWIIYAMYISIVKDNNYIAKIVLLGTLAIFIAAIHDVIYNNEIMQGLSISYTPYGIIFFLMFQAFVIAIKNQNAYKLAERLTNDLEIIVEERTKELNKAFQLIKNDLKVAKNIQSKLLPLEVRSLSGLNFISKYIPMGEVGGDLFDIHDMGEGRVRILIADATGHGVRAALITMLIKSEYDSLKDTVYSPSELLNIFNKVFYKKYPNLNYYFTCFVIDIDTKKRELQYASAAHPEQFLIQKNKLERLPKTGILPGVKIDIKYREESFKYKKGDKLLLFTDGFFEEFNKKGIEFGEEHLSSIIVKHKSKKIDSIISNCFKELETFMDGEPSNDDITVLGIELN